MSNRTNWTDLTAATPLSPAAREAHDDEARLAAFRALVHRLRTDAGLTQADLAARMGVTQSAIRSDGGRRDATHAGDYGEARPRGRLRPRHRRRSRDRRGERYQVTRALRSRRRTRCKLTMSGRRTGRRRDGPTATLETRLLRHRNRPPDTARTFPECSHSDPVTRKYALLPGPMRKRPVLQSRVPGPIPGAGPAGP